MRLRGRPVDILVLLLSRRGELVTRDELRSALWSADTFVDFDHGLNSAMNKLRDALGDAAERSRYIETVPRRGYRFVAPVDVVTDAAAVAAVDGTPAHLVLARAARRVAHQRERRAGGAAQPYRTGAHRPDAARGAPAT